MTDEPEEGSLSRKTTMTVGLVIGLLGTLGGALFFLDTRIGNGERRLLEGINENGKHVTELRIAMQRLESATDANRQLVRQKHDVLEKTIDDLNARIRALEDK